MEELRLTRGPNGTTSRPNWLGALDFLEGADISEVPVNYYGIANTLLPYISTYKFNLPIRSYYHPTHILAVSCAIGTTILLWWASKVSQLSNRWLAPLMLLASPTFFGYSLMNIKDIPIAFLYTLLTCSLLWSYKYLHNFTLRRLGLATVITSLIAGLFVSLRLTLLPVTLATFVLILSFSIPSYSNRHFSLSQAGKAVLRRS